MKIPFILQYFQAIFNPTHIFRGRHALSWPKLIVIQLFLLACLMMPISLQLAMMKSFQFSYLMPSVSASISEDFAAALKDYQIKDGRLVGHSEIYADEGEGNLLAIDLQGEQYNVVGEDQLFAVTGFKNAILFTQNYMIVSDQNGYGFRLYYPISGNYPFDITSAADIETYIATIWFQQNKLFILPILIMMIAGILVLMNVLSLLVMACILWLTKKSNITDIATFKESVNLILNAMGLPTLIAMVYAFFQFDITVIMMIQSFGTVLMIAFTFFRTRFRDPEKLSTK